MKRIFSFLLSVSLLLSIAGCTFNGKVSDINYNSATDSSTRSSNISVSSSNTSNISGSFSNSSGISTTPGQNPVYTHVSKVGKLPADYTKAIIDNNLPLNAVKTVDGYLLFFTDDHKKSGVKKFDLKGNLLWTKFYSEISSETVYGGNISLTGDGGFIVWATGSTNYNPDGTRVSFEPAIIKCDKTGSVQWQKDYKGFSDTTLQKVFCSLKGDVITIGYTESKDSKSNSVGSRIYLSKLDSKGKFLEEKSYGGTSYDILFEAEYIEGAGVVSLINSQSKGGPFPAPKGGSSIRVLAYFDMALEISWFKTLPESEYFDSPAVFNKEIYVCRYKSTGAGFESWDRYLVKYDIKGNEAFSKPLGRTSTIPYIKGYKVEFYLLYNNKLSLLDANGNANFEVPFSAGYIEKIIEYDDYFLVLSQNITGKLPQPLYISSIWQSTELVYSGYDYKGKLLWRDAFDSTPDFMRKYDPKVNSDWTVIGG